MLENYPLTVGKLQRLLTLGDLKHAICLETILHSQLSNHEAGSQTPSSSVLQTQAFINLDSGADASWSAETAFHSLS